MGLFDWGNGNGKRDRVEPVLEKNALLLIQEMNEAIEEGEMFLLEGTNLVLFASHINFLLGETVRLRMTVDTLSRHKNTNTN